MKTDNEIIAEFMGARLGNGGTKKYPVYTNVPVTHAGVTQTWTFSSKDFRYHSSWDWLMPVVEKIPELNPHTNKVWFEFEISRCYCNIYSNNGQRFKNNSDTTLNAVYKSVVDFLNWYNSQTQH